MPHGITQCYLPPGRGDIPALTPAEAGTRLSDPPSSGVCPLCPTQYMALRKSYPKRHLDRFSRFVGLTVVTDTQHT